uniref:Uncharacterized protein n=1 Tax=Setaria viridis TaxID=4556 RepID=A0A4U6TQ74_SETVI|nr:hypothetical protein SEVIR_7G085700v2 [Setaria viridis]
MVQSSDMTVVQELLSKLSQWKLRGGLFYALPCTDLHRLSKWQCTLDCLPSRVYNHSLLFSLNFLQSPGRMRTQHDDGAHVGAPWHASTSLVRTVAWSS